jgi:hypothetical protein
MAQAPLIKLAPQLNFMWDELQGPESRTMRMFEANPNMGPGQYASLFEKMYERAGGAGDEIAQKYAQDVYSAMQDPVKAEGLPPNAKFAYGYLTQKGMTPQQAAGITGRLMVESYPRMDPSARNTIGGGAGTLGVAQWRGPRLEALAKSAGVSMDDIRALPSSTPEGNYYSQSGSGGKKMAGGLLNMMPGATPEQEQAQPQGGGFKNFLTNPDFLDSLAIGFGGMTMRPNTGVIEAAQSRMKSRAASRQDAQTRNKTVEWLRANGREDLAGAVESGAIDGKTAVTLAYEEPKDKGQIVSAEQMRKMFPGTAIEDGLYNLKPDGTANKVGGGGTTINMPGGESSEFRKVNDKNLAEQIGVMASGGLAAQRNLGFIAELDRVLQEAPQGFGGALVSMAGNFGLELGEGAGAVQAAQAIINRLVPQQREPGSGPMSDADLDLFKQSLPRIINQPDGNRRIIDTIKAISQYDIDRGNIARRAQMGEISPYEALRQIESLPNPLGWVRSMSTQAPTQEDRDAAVRALIGE